MTPPSTTTPDTLLVLLEDSLKESLYMEKVLAPERVNKSALMFPASIMQVPEGHLMSADRVKDNAAGVVYVPAARTMTVLPLGVGQFHFAIPALLASMASRKLQTPSWSDRPMPKLLMVYVVAWAPEMRPEARTAARRENPRDAA
jgi:hypothetical protein